MSKRKTMEEVFEILADSISAAYIAEFEYQKSQGYISSMGTVYYSEAIDRWTETELPELIEKFYPNYRFMDGGGFANAYKGAHIILDGYNFSLKAVFDKVKYRAQ